MQECCGWCGWLKAVCTKQSNRLMDTTLGTDNKRPKAVTLIEVLVALALVVMIWAIMLPILIKTRRDAFAVRTMNNQRQIVVGVNCFALDHNGDYPKSVATIGRINEHWSWQEPTMLTSSGGRSPLLHHRSMAAYLRRYIEDAGIMFCPNAPKKYKYLQQAWDAGDKWDNPDTLASEDAVIGTYCFYWNYTGFLDELGVPFTGPQSPAGGLGQSKLLVSDYFGYGHWRNGNVYANCNAYTSCERFKGASVTPGTSVSSDFWSCPAENAGDGLDAMSIKLHAGYTDGHVETFTPSQTIPMRVSITADGSVPYPSGIGPGIIYLPKDALR